MLKPTIISLSMATVMAGSAISPALGLIAEAFPEADPVIIKLILTAPSLMIVPFSFISSFLTTKMSKRSILFIGLSIYLISGVGAQFLRSIELLLVFRLILGAGVGLIMPLSMSIINDYFTGDERTQMMGYNSAFSNLGGVITVTVAGFLAGYGWHVPFNVYLIGLVIAGLVFFYLPKNKTQKPKDNEPKMRVPFIVYGYGLFMCGIMIAYYSVATNMALFLEQNNIGGAVLAGSIISFTTVGGMITSLMLVRLEALFKSFIIPIMLFGMGIAFTIISFTSSITLLFIGACFIGFGQGVLFPVIILKALDHVPSHKSDRAGAITTSFIFLGQFLSPILLDGIASLFHSHSLRLQYGVIAVLILLTALLNILFLLRRSYQLKKTENQDIQSKVLSTHRE